MSLKTYYRTSKLILGHQYFCVTSGAFRLKIISKNITSSPRGVASGLAFFYGPISTNGTQYQGMHARDRKSRPEIASICLGLTCDHAPFPLYNWRGNEDMIHFLIGSHVEKQESVFFTDWSRNNTYWFMVVFWLVVLFQRDFRWRRRMFTARMSSNEIWIALAEAPTSTSNTFSVKTKQVVVATRNLYTWRCFGS